MAKHKTEFYRKGVINIEKVNVTISPIFYMGNKKKLISKGLCNLFPTNIDTYFELFAGSAIVAMNTQAHDYVINDKDNNLKRLYMLFGKYSSEKIISEINKRIDHYGLARERTKRNQYFDLDKLERYKTAYIKLRNHYNSIKEDTEEKLFDFYTLMFYSFSQQFRFNSKGDFNMPVGNDCFSEKNQSYIANGCRFFNADNVVITDTLDFASIPPTVISKNDFVYLDPPYLNTTATYNENNGWNTDDELRLYSYCEKLNDNGIKFGMSNVFENKGQINDRLIDWCERNHWNVYTFNKFTYMACGRGNSQAKEVYICNY